MEHLGKLKMPRVGEAMGQLAPLLGLLTVIKQTMPVDGHKAFWFCQRQLKGLLDPVCFYTINEFEGNVPNDLYRDVHLHLESRKAYNKAKRLTLFRRPNRTSLSMRLSNSDDAITDTYKGMTVWWTHIEATKEKLPYRDSYSGGAPVREFQLKIRKRDKARLLPEYLDFIARNSREYSGRTGQLKIYTNSESPQFTTSGSRRMWEEISYKHPSTFDTLALDPCLKEKIIADLTSFTTDKAFYERTGRAWKRGYLLHGPPGTGKSSMVAAMANLLKYDIYDLELSQVRSNGELRQLLIQTTNRSIIVLEDIDCSVKFIRNRNDFLSMGMPVEDDQSKVTLSGLLNFVDGLWSCCGDERIFVFTTNQAEKLDKALLRPGRMDMQIELSYCTFPAFKVLAQNYLATQDHPLFEKLESAFVGKTMTPAQIAEVLIKDKSNVDLALDNVISALESNAPESLNATSWEEEEDDDVEACENENGMECVSSRLMNARNLDSTLETSIIEAVQEEDINTFMQLPPSELVAPSCSRQLPQAVSYMADLVTLLHNNSDGLEYSEYMEDVFRGLENNLLSDFQSTEGQTQLRQNQTSVKRKHRQPTV